MTLLYFAVLINQFWYPLVTELHPWTLVIGVATVIGCGFVGRLSMPIYQPLTSPLPSAKSTSELGVSTFHPLAIGQQVRIAGGLLLAVVAIGGGYFYALTKLLTKPYPLPLLDLLTLLLLLTLLGCISAVLVATASNRLRRRARSWGVKTPALIACISAIALAVFIGPAFFDIAFVLMISYH